MSTGDTTMDGRPIKLMVIRNDDGTVQVGNAPKVEGRGPCCPTGGPVCKAWLGGLSIELQHWSL